MIQVGHRAVIGAAVRLSLACACVILADMAVPAQAQDALPTVNEYHLPPPTPTPTPRVRPPGPVDRDVPEVAAPAQPQSAPAETPAAAASPAPPARPRAGPKPAPQPSAAAAAATPATPAAGRAAPSPRPSSSEAARTQASPAPVAAPAPATTPVPSPEASAPAIAWHTHSAADDVAGEKPHFPWLTLLAFVLGAGAALGIQQAISRQRAARAAAASDWDTYTEPAPQPAPAIPPPPHPGVVRDDAPTAQLPPPLAAQPPLDLLSFMAEPQEAPPPAASPPATNGAAPADEPSTSKIPAARAGPIALGLSARRLSATLMNTVLNYELTISNSGPDAIGPITVGGDMIGAHASLPTRSQLELTSNTIAPLHRVPSLAAGESVVLTGEFRLPLTAITPIRSGNAALFIPLARFRAEAIGKSGLPLVVSQTFVVGENQDRPGAALKPFRLDLGPRLYSQIGQRELALTA